MKYDSGKMKRVAILGGTGFIGHHLANRLIREGCWVRIVDILPVRYPTKFDEFLQLDLSIQDHAQKALSLSSNYKYNAPVFDEVYQLACQMGGMGYISSNETTCLTENAMININCAKAAHDAKVGKYFFSSSVCIYRDVKEGEQLKEEDVYNGYPDNEYGWEKLYSERVLQAFARNEGLDVRIARFQNCYGPEGTWQGGREKAPAAICRKVAQAENPGQIEVWGDGTAIRNYTYIDDMIDGILALMKSKIKEPTNIGTYEETSVDDLVRAVTTISGKDIKVNHIKGPTGVQRRNFSKDRIMSTGWKPKVKLPEGIKKTYQWIESQLAKS